MNIQGLHHHGRTHNDVLTFQLQEGGSLVLKVTAYKKDCIMALGPNSTPYKIVVRQDKILVQEFTKIDEKIAILVKE